MSSSRLRFHDLHFNETQHHDTSEIERSVSPCEMPASAPQLRPRFSGLTSVLQEELDLRLASADNPSVVMELDLECNVRYVSKNWTTLVGTNVRKIINKPIQNILIGKSETDLRVFNDAVDKMILDNASYKVKFVTATNSKNLYKQTEDAYEDAVIDNEPFDDVRSLNVEKQDLRLDDPPILQLGESFQFKGSDESIKTSADLTSEINLNALLNPCTEEFPATILDLQHSPSASSTSSKLSNDGDLIELEAQGILIHDTNTKIPTHSIWTIRPFVRIELDLNIPEALVDLLGFGLELFEGYLLSLQEAGIIDEESVPEPKLILCRICETSIPAWFIERHNSLCLLEHKVDEELQVCHDAIADHRDHLLRIAESLWNEQLEGLSSMSSGNSSNSSLGSTSSNSVHDYKGIQLPLMSPEPSLGHAPLKRASFSGIIGSRKFPFGILQKLVDLCEEGLSLNPAEKKEETGEFAFSPNTFKTIETVLSWQTLETSDPAIRAMVDDTKHLVNEKVENLTRLISIAQYTDRIKQEVDAYVLEAVQDTILKIREKTREQEVPEHKQRTLLTSSRSRASSVSAPMLNSGGFTKVDEKLPAFRPISPLKNPLSPTLTPLQVPGLKSPQPYRVRSPNNPILSEGVSSAPLKSITPKDILRDIPDFNRSRSSILPNTTLSAAARLPPRDIADALNDLSMSGKSLESSLSSPRRHLSPLPYVEKQTFSTLQRNTNVNLRHDQSLLLSPRYSLVSLDKNDLVLSPEMGPMGIKKNTSSSSLVLPQLASVPITGQFQPHQTLNANQSSSTQRGSFLSMKPPLSPLLVLLMPAPKSVSTGIKDYEIIKAISKGAFGSVFLAKRRLTGEYVAIKCLKKTDMIVKNQVLNVKSERAVMMKQSDSPYVAQLYCSFQTKDYLYLVMEYLNGGDCAALLKMLGTLDEKWTKRYIAEIIVGVDDLHKRDIIHRDLKPDNILIDSKGHLKLTDFGLSKMGVIGRHTLRHRKSSASEHAIEFFRKHNLSTGIGQSPLVTAGMIDSPDLGPHHKRTSSVTPFSLSPSTEMNRPPFLAHTTLSSLSSHELTAPLAANKKRTRSHHFRNASTRSDSASSGLDLPNLKATIPRTSSESSFAIIDDEFLVSPNQNEETINSYALFDPTKESESIKTFVGTPDYLAPETISGEEQGEYSDWWSLGCILFEFIYGYPPFHDETPDKVFQNILRGDISWPPLSEEEDMKICPPLAKDLIKKLLILDPQERLGFNGAEEIKEHPFFQDVEWDKLYVEETDSFVPVLDGPESTDYFDLRGADISLFPKDESDDEQTETQSARDVYPGGNHAALQHNYQSLPTTPVISKRERRGSKLGDPSEFGSFHFRNLNVLEKQNKDVINRLKSEHMEHRNSMSSSSSESTPGGYTKSRGLSVSSNIVSLGSPFKRPVSPVTTFNQSPHKEKSFAHLQIRHERASSGGAMSGSSSVASVNSGTSCTIGGPMTGNEIRQRALVPSLSKQLFQRNVGDALSSPTSSDNEESSLALSRVKQRRESMRKNSILGSGVSSTPTQLSQSNPPTDCYNELDVLYCEPIPIVRHSVAKIIERCGCIVLAISDGDDLIRRATSKVKFDLIFTALRLPKVEAVDAVKLIKYTSGVNSQTPVIALTGFAKEALELGAFDEVLEKPVDERMIRNIISKFSCDDTAVEWESED